MEDVLRCPSKFKIGDIVWAKSRKCSDWPWPARVVNPDQFAPQDLLEQHRRAGDICIVFFDGLAPTKVKHTDTDYTWVNQREVLEFTNSGREFQADGGCLAKCLGLAVHEAGRIFSKAKRHIEFTNVKECSPSTLTVDEQNQDALPLPVYKQEPRKRLKVGHAKCWAFFASDMQWGGETQADCTLATVPVECAGIEGAYVPKSHEVICMCCDCEGQNVLGISRWEAHTGCRSKKWKMSVKLKDSNKTLFSWLEELTDNSLDGLLYQARAHEHMLRAYLEKPFIPVVKKWTAEHCAVCGWEEDFDYNQMLICNRCQIAVHEECCGVRVSETGGSFICRVCETPSIERQCCLCPIKGGALKPTDIEDFWVHISCAWFVRQMFFKNIVKMEPACGLTDINLNQFKLKCVVCEEVHGACIKCDEDGCTKVYHATCALCAGYRMEISSVTDRFGKQSSRKVSYCFQHWKPNRHRRVVLPALEAELCNQITDVESPIASGIITQVSSSSSSSSLAIQEIPLSLHNISIDACGVSRCCVYNLDDHKQKSRGEARVHEVGGFSWHHREAIAAFRNMPEPMELLSTEDRLIHLTRTQNSRICIGKSAIHNYGIFARQDIQEEEMVVEYKGEIVRRVVADMRESKYRQEGKDCYLFKVSDEMVIDATNKGNVARLINHSCIPNCYARIFPVQSPGDSCIIFISRKLIKAGEELTYDYQFDPENCKVPCLCGAPNCRKFIC